MSRPGWVSYAAQAGLTGAGAVLVNRYSFTANANDSIGGANGTVVDAGAAIFMAFSYGGSRGAAKPYLASTR